MLKIALLLSLMGFDLVFARRDLGRCGSFGCSTNDNISRKHEHKKHHKRHDPFKCDSSSSSSSSDSSSSSSSSSDSGHHRVKKLDCDFGEFTDMDSSDCIVRRRKHRRRRCDSSSGYSSCSSSSSSSSSSCSSSSSSSSSGVTPIPGNRCTALFETALRVLDGALLTYLKNFELQYKQQIISFLTNAIAGINAFNPVFTTGTDYVALVAAINAALPAGATPLPASVATELLNIQTATIAAIVKAIQNTINGVLGDLLARVQSLCLNELIDFINSGLLTSQLTSAFALAINEIAPAVNTMITAQLALLQQYNLPAAILATVTTTLTNNGTALTAFLTAQLGLLQGQIATLLSNLLTALATLITNGVKAFQNLAISQINALVTKIFGTIGVPIPIPPVV